MNAPFNCPSHFFPKEYWYITAVLMISLVSDIRDYSLDTGKQPFENKRWTNTMLRSHCDNFRVYWYVKLFRQWFKFYMNRYFAGRAQFVFSAGSERAVCVYMWGGRVLFQNLCDLCRSACITRFQFYIPSFIWVKSKPERH